MALGICAALVLIELAARIATGSLFTWRNKESESYVEVVPLLGRIPKAGLSVRHPGGFAINIGDHGTRRNGEGPSPGERPLTLVVGDSFAFGDGVDDEDSWPAVLERQSGRRVINAAVPGFGLDQAVLRAEQLAAVYAPDVIIASFIPHDILRGEMSYWSGHPKPYFTLDSEGLRLHAAPTPTHPALAIVKRLLSWSVAVDAAFPTLNWEGPEEVVVHHDGPQVACRLMQRLAALGRAHHARVIVLAQPQAPTATPEQRQVTRDVLKCARENQLTTVDLFPVIDGLPLEQRVPLFPRHMSPEGNRLVAGALADALEQAAPPPARP